MHLAKVDNAHILGSEVVASNGIVYPIDGLLVPAAFVEPRQPLDLKGDIEEWLPYKVGQPLRIGDAELVPGHPIMRDGVAQLGDLVLKKGGAKINTARTVRLEGDGETIYLAPIAPNEYSKDKSAFEKAAAGQRAIIGALVVFSPTQQIYAQRVRLEGARWLVEYVRPDGTIAITTEVGVPEPPKDDDNVPVAGICYGTKWWCIHWLGYVWCSTLWWLGATGPYSTYAACINACQ
jgi:hypothetical protein